MITIDDLCDLEPKPLNQAERIIAKFGGPARLSRILLSIGTPITRTTIYRWTYPKPKGSGGVIPSRALKIILEAAHFDGVLITSEDMDIR